MPVAHDEFDHKDNRLQAFMEHHALEAVILTLRANYAWYTCGGCNHVPTASALGTASILVTQDRPLCVTSNIEAARQREAEGMYAGPRLPEPEFPVGGRGLDVPVEG